MKTLYYIVVTGSDKVKMCVNHNILCLYFYYYFCKRTHFHEFASKVDPAETASVGAVSLGF